MVMAATTVAIVPLIVWAFWIGLYPKPFFRILEKPVDAIVERVNPDFFKTPPVSPKLPSLDKTLPPGALGVHPATVSLDPGVTR